MEHILIVGGSGFVGQTLVRHFVELGWRVTVFDLRAGRFEHEQVRYHTVDVQSGKLPTLTTCNVIINLAGVSINQRFTPEHKKLIWSSRIISTRSIRQWVETQGWQPSIYIGASAVGYYGDRGTELLSTTTKPGDDFLARICVDWEREHKAFEKLNIPVAILRQGHIFGRAGFLGELLPMFKHGIRLSFGKGNFYLPWIDIRDLTSIYAAIATKELVPATYNAVSVHSIQFSDLSHTLGAITHARIPLSVPSWILRLRFGELADYLTASQRVQPSSPITPYTQTLLLDSLEFWSSQ